MVTEVAEAVENEIAPGRPITIPLKAALTLAAVYGLYRTWEWYKDTDCPTETPENGDNDLVTVYTITDEPVNLNRLPDPTARAGSAKAMGGTFVTLEDITDPERLKLHVARHIPKTRIGPHYPPILTEIKISKKYLTPDPHAPCGPTRWIPPGSPGEITRTWDVKEDPTTLLPIITPRK